MGELQNVFDFTQEDLRANQMGQLSASQQENLQSYSNQFGCASVVALIFVVVSIIAIFAYALSSGEFDMATFQEVLPIMVLVFGGSFLLVVFFILLGFYRARDMRSGKLSTAEGEAHCWTKKQRYFVEYHFKIGKTKFRATSQSQYDAIDPDLSYRVYYVKNPPAHIIFSIEPLL